MANGASLTYTGQFLDEDEDPIALNGLESLTLSIIDRNPAGGPSSLVNDVEDEDILNTGRGTVDSEGKLTLKLLTTDTTITEKAVDRSLVLTWVYNTDRIGRHEVVFKIVSLSGDA